MPYNKCNKIYGSDNFFVGLANFLYILLCLLEFLGIVPMYAKKSPIPDDS